MPARLGEHGHSPGRGLQGARFCARHRGPGVNVKRRPCHGPPEDSVLGDKPVESSMVPAGTSGMSCSSKASPRPRVPLHSEPGGVVVAAPPAPEAAARAVEGDSAEISAGATGTVRAKAHRRPGAPPPAVPPTAANRSSRAVRRRGRDTRAACRARTSLGDEGDGSTSGTMGGADGEGEGAFGKASRASTRAAMR